jgi:mRNA-degrading endonuclease RelE of RelBE toxin-antitoxin system
MENEWLCERKSRRGVFVWIIAAASMLKDDGLAIWELRVGEYRVFYDISLTESVVYVRAVRRKPRGAKTEDIL